MNILATEKDSHIIGFYAGDSSDSEDHFMPLWTTHLKEVYTFEDIDKVSTIFNKLRNEIPHLNFYIFTRND